MDLTTLLLALCASAALAVAALAVWGDERRRLKEENRRLRGRCERYKAACEYLISRAK